MAAVNQIAPPAPVAEAVSHNQVGQKLGRKGQQTRERILSAMLELLAEVDGPPVTLTAVRLETIRTRAGEQSALLIVPSMAPGQERGMFKRGGEVKVWISQGNDPQPVKMQITLSFGTGTLYLVEHTAPATTTLVQSTP